MKSNQLLYTSDLFEYVESFADESSENKYEDGLKALKTAYLYDFDSEYELNEDRLLDIASDALTIDYDDLLERLDKLVGDYDCVLYGTLGLWNSTPTIYPMRFGYISEAIRKIAGGVDDIEIYRYYGKLNVVGRHHDGSNDFWISLLNDKGQYAGDDADLSKRWYHKAIDWSAF